MPLTPESSPRLMAVKPLVSAGSKLETQTNTVEQNDSLQPTVLSLQEVDGGVQVDDWDVVKSDEEYEVVVEKKEDLGIESDEEYEVVVEKKEDLRSNGGKDQNKNKMKLRKYVNVRENLGIESDGEDSETEYNGDKGLGQTEFGKDEESLVEAVALSDSYSGDISDSDEFGDSSESDEYEGENEEDSTLKDSLVITRGRLERKGKKVVGSEFNNDSSPILSEDQDQDQTGFGEDDVVEGKGSLGEIIDLQTQQQDNLSLVNDKIEIYKSEMVLINMAQDVEIRPELEGVGGAVEIEKEIAGVTEEGRVEAIVKAIEEENMKHVVRTETEIYNKNDVTEGNWKMQKRRRGTQ